MPIHLIVQQIAIVITTCMFGYFSPSLPAAILFAVCGAVLLTASWMLNKDNGAQS